MPDNPKNDINGRRDGETYQGVGSFLLEVVKVFILAFVIIVPIRIFLFQPFFVQGASMSPTFENGEYLIVNEIGYKKTEIGFEGMKFFTIGPSKDLERGDVIVFRYPKNPKQFFIKRVIGLSGEKIEIKNGQVIIYNEEFTEGFVLDESDYIPGVKTLAGGGISVKLNEESYFVMGDNRSASHDSRSWGPLGEDKVIGKVLIRAWPVNRADIF